MQHKKTFLGIGWKFPPTFDKKTKSVVLVSEEEDIRESLLILLSTRPGERVMQPEYGCNLSILNFEPANISLLSLARTSIEYAVLHFEARITLENVTILADRWYDGIIEINMEYTVRTTNERSNIVFPYYILEGTNVEEMPK